MANVEWPVARCPSSEAVIERGDRFLAVVPEAMQSRWVECAIVELNKLPKDVSVLSAVVAAQHSALLRLIPGQVLGHCYFIPFRQKGQNERQVQLIIGYQGYLEMAMQQASFLSALHTEVVLEGEPFQYWVDSTGPQLKHEIGIRGDYGKPQVVASYCIYQTQSGGRGMRIVSRQELDRVDRAKGGKTTEGGFNPWATEYAAMSQKTAIRRAAKNWPKTQRLSRALLIEDAHDDGRPVELDDVESFAPKGAGDLSLDDYKEPAVET